MPSTDLLDTPITDRDWQARAWERLRDVRATRHGWTLDDALADPRIGRIVRAFGAQLRQQHEQRQRALEKEARYGQKVEWNGYGYAPKIKRRTP
ncbi:MAG: hypothetical protein ACRC8U_10655 [Brooklawnia sp.]